MAVGSVQNPAQLTQQTGSSSTTNSNNTLGKDAFMKLLVAQLKNQDPLNPTDAKEFVTQLSQLTGVEQMTAMSDKLTGLQTATNNLLGNQAANLVGKKIEASSSKVTLGDLGSVSGSFKLLAPADTVQVSLIDGTGATVKTLDVAATKAGAVSFDWNGMSENGTRANSGQYTVSVAAKDAKGNPVATDMTVSGTVSGVSYKGGSPELVLNNNKHVALADVVTVSQ